MTGAAEAPALAWMLETSGGGAFTVLVLDRLVLTGISHGLGNGWEYKPVIHPSTYAAQMMAQTLTDIQVGHGYRLAIPPIKHTYNVVPDEAIRRIMEQPYTRPNFMEEIFRDGARLVGIS